MLKQCVVLFQGRDELAFYSRTLLEQINLLERQILIEQSDTAEPPRGIIIDTHTHSLSLLSPPSLADSPMARVPRFSVLFTPVSATTYYCLLYHSNAPKGRIASPLNLQNVFGIPERRMTWLTLRARARMNDWQAVKALAAPTGFFSSSPSSPIGFEPFVEVLAQTSAPIELLAYFAALIESPERRCVVAEKYRIVRYISFTQCIAHQRFFQHSVAVEALLQLRQRARAMRYLAKLREVNLPDLAATLERALNDASIRWS